MNAMKEKKGVLTVVLTGFEDEETKEMKRKANKCQLSVIQLQDANTKFDVLIANTSHSPKYEIAVLRNIPIVSRVWMDACAESGELTYEYEKFPFKFFTDCVVCVTGFQWEERNGIQEMVEKNGGVFSADLEKDVVTHLIAKQTSAGEEPTGAKYRHARMWDMWVLSKKWVEDCVKRGVKLNEYEYDVKNGISNSKQTDSSLELLKKQPEVPFPTKEELTKELEEEYDEDQTPWGQHYLFSTKVYLVGFSCSNNSTSTPAAGGTAVDPNDILRPSAKNARLAHKILRAGGATVAMNPQNATHVVINDDLECQKDVDFILRTYMRPHREKCVTFEWLKKCSEEGRTMPKSKRFRVAKERFSEVIAAPTFCNDPVTTFDDDDKKTSWTNYKNDNTSPPRRIPERSPLKVIDKDKNPLRRQPAMVKKDDIETQQHAPAADDIVVRRGNDKQQSRRDNDKNNKYNTMTEQIPETRAAIGETALVNNEDEDDALLLGRNGYNSRNESSDHSSKQSQLYPLANVKLSLFEGLCIGEKEVALNLISLLGGEYLRGSSTSTLASSDFIICPALPSMSEKKKLQALASDIASAARENPDAIFSARFVAPHFLEGVSLEGKIFKPSESMAYQPYMDHDGKFLSMKGVVLSPSSYTEREKSAIRMLSLICGCECTENLKKGKNTHVVVSKAEGSKYKAGVNWNKKVVTKEWLEECARKGHKVDESRFAPPLPGAMLEETQGEETLNDDATADAKKRSDPSIEGGGGGSGSGGEKTVEKTAEKKIAYAEEEEEEEEDIASKHSLWVENESQCTLRMIHYPPFDSVEEAEDQAKMGYMRAGAHTDWCNVTLLYQRTEFGNGGLECAANPRRDGFENTEWAQIDHTNPGAITVNIGDMLSRWTNGDLLSNLHRVRMPEGEEALKSRHSMAFFAQADESAVIRAYPGQESLTAKEYILGRIRSNYGGTTDKAVMAAAAAV